MQLASCCYKNKVAPNVELLDLSEELSAITVSMITFPADSEAVVLPDDLITLSTKKTSCSYLGNSIHEFLHKIILKKEVVVSKVFLSF